MLSKNADIGSFIIITTGLILLLIGFIILILFLYKRRQIGFLNHVEGLKNDYEKSLLSSKLEIQEQTLRDVSYEIHDNITLSLSVAKLNLETIKWDNTAEIPYKVNDTLNQVIKTLEDLRLLSKTLNSNYIKSFGLPGAVELEMEKIERLKIFQTRFEINGTDTSMETKKEVIIFRIIQEALHNSIRHSGASSLFVKMQYTSTHLYVKVCDDGVWKEKPENGEAEQAGLGLTNMQHRARLLNGGCTVEHTPGKGTTVSLTIPL